jgi:hypothetical protein
MATISIRLTLPEARAEWLQAVMEDIASDSREWNDEARATARSVATTIGKARTSTKKADGHKAGDMWRHAKESTGEAIYKPMFVRRVERLENGWKLHMSDKCEWTPAELEANGWKRGRK